MIRRSLRDEAGRLGLLDRVAAAQTVLDWPGVVLPKGRFSYTTAYPVIEWAQDVERRLALNVGPMTHRPTLVEWEAEGPPAPLRIVGFIADGPALSSLDQLKGLAAYGAGAILVLSSRRLGRWTMAEADMAGISVVEIAACSSTCGAQLALRGRAGPVVTARRTVASRLREEQLFEWALRCDVRPVDAGSRALKVALF